MQREPQTTRERAILLLSATLLPEWSLTASQQIVWVIRGALLLGVFGLIATAVDKPLWAWLNLLFVPLVLAVGGYLFNSSQNRATEAAAEQRAQDEALQAYLKDMSDMLIPKEAQPSLSEEHPPNSVRSVARARTLTVLTRLDGVRKARVVQFLYEAGLIAKNNPIVPLAGSDLRLAVLRLAVLRLAVLRGAALSGAVLSGADLTDAFLLKADLSGAVLSGAVLNRAVLSWSQGWTEDQLSAALSLEGAAMPNAQMYEDWLKDREGSE